MNYTLFDVLLYLEFESNNLDYDDLPAKLRNWDFRCAVWENSKLLNIWYKIFQIAPNIRNFDKWFSRWLGGHFSIGNLTVFGCNAMMFSFCYRIPGKGTWNFRPPCFNLHWRKWTWGLLYFSPNGTPRHPLAKIYYTDGY
ncbi:hypothetical protein ELBI_89 [Anabaena phage Elbi]|nr:hypothetical protein ELBI_89 [Anabaena phage Elbi]